MPIRSTIAHYAPERFVMWYRRRREVRIYLHEMGDILWVQRLRTIELQQRGDPVSNEEMVMEGGTGAWLAWAVRDIVERNDIVLKAMERKIEALTARHGQQIRNLRDQVEAIQGHLSAIEGQLAALNGSSPAAALPAGSDRVAEQPADGAAAVEAEATEAGPADVEPAAAPAE
jgi:hypothetical protein